MIPFSVTQQAAGTDAQQDGVQDDDVDGGMRERWRRAQVVRLGLILVLLLALFDTGPGSRDLSLNEHADSTIASTAYTDRLNSIISSKRNLAVPFPKNVTGLYRGGWERLRGGASPSRASGVNKSEVISVAPGSSVSATSGKIILQLKSVAIANVAEMSFVYGVLRLSNSGLRGSDLLYPLQGLYLSTSGQLTMITSPFSSQKLYVLVPISDTIGSNAPAINSSRTAHRQNQRRRLTGAQDKISTFGSEMLDEFLSQASRFVAGKLKHLKMNILNEEQLASQWLASGLDETFENDLDHVPSSRRRLDEAAGFYSAKLEFGMRLVLADSISIAEMRKNSSYMIETVSEGLLPASFKNLQYGVLHSAAPGGCQVAMRLSAAALILNQNDKDIPLLPGISPTSAKLTPTVGSGESFSSNLNGAIEAQSCGFINSGFNISAQSYHLQVNKVEHKAFNYAIIATTICFIQMALLVVQLRYAQNPAMASKVSVVGMCAQALIDALVCVGHLLLCAAIPGIFFQHFMWIAMLKLVIFCAFEMRAVMGIYHSRYAQEASTLGWMGLRRRLASLHFRFYASLFLAMFMTITLRSQPVILILCLYSCWVPQIVYNAASGTRRAFHPIYMYGMATSRLFIPLYIFGCPHNFLSLLMVETASFPFSPVACFVLFVWTCLQVGILTLQDTLGPRFFVPKQWLPPKYDYNRPVPRHVVQSQSSSGNDNETGSGQDVSSAENTTPCESITCVVCYNPVVLSYGEYMIAPCDHVFHKECLGRWMAIKLECPTCRSPLEPADE